MEQCLEKGPYLDLRSSAPAPVAAARTAVGSSLKSRMRTTRCALCRLKYFELVCTHDLAHSVPDVEGLRCTRWSGCDECTLRCICDPIEPGPRARRTARRRCSCRFLGLVLPVVSVSPSVVIVSTLLVGFHSFAFLYGKIGAKEKNWCPVFFFSG